MNHHLLTLASVTIVFTALPALAQTQTVIASGLKNPARLITTDNGNLLVSEAGDNTPNTGRLSRIPESQKDRQFGFET